MKTSSKRIMCAVLSLVFAGGAIAVAAYLDDSGFVAHLREVIRAREGRGFSGDSTGYYIIRVGVDDGREVDVGVAKVGGALMTGDGEIIPWDTVLASRVASPEVLSRPLDASLYDMYRNDIDYVLLSEGAKRVYAKAMGWIAEDYSESDADRVDCVEAEYGRLVRSLSRPWNGWSVIERHSKSLTLLMGDVCDLPHRETMELVCHRILYTNERVGYWRGVEAQGGGRAYGVLAWMCDASDARFAAGREFRAVPGHASAMMALWAMSAEELAIIARFWNEIALTRMTYMDDGVWNVFCIGDVIRAFAAMKVGAGCSREAFAEWVEELSGRVK